MPPATLRTDGERMVLLMPVSMGYVCDKAFQEFTVSAELRLKLIADIEITSTSAHI